ncbi:MULTISPECIES: hypothetical protein [unclassified Microbacterium]|jgi:hypothetical protein|uniref:hypothetical protein n=1 Tax=unclassified Microbacterium TaxID=2609290 RepID=UPI000E051115|nr:MULTISPECIES: hypothetical protein [unclassified Microbacterium]MTE24903.1 hypothetical protein [Microbacterium sp. ZXX196]STY69591.1 Uncharacterised protein [Micrococcus luteus]
MPRTTLTFGGLLISVGIISYAVTGFISWTALIPAFLGMLIVICGLIALKNTTIGLSIALVISVLGVLGTSMNVLKVGELISGQAECPLAIGASTVTFVLLIVYIVTGVRLFLTARRGDKAEATTA